ncbi:MAG: hypothetical protein ABI685_11745, partial [Ferruginibacter sp.]
VGFTLFYYREDAKLQNSLTHLAGCVINVHGFNFLIFARPSPAGEFLAKVFSENKLFMAILF